MRIRIVVVLLGITMSLGMVMPTYGATPSDPDTSHLTLTEAEAMALDRDPLIAGIKASARAFREQAIAAQQLPDPRLVLGIVDLPTDSFSFKEPETQKMIGLQQSFPPWGSLTRRGAEIVAMAESDEAALKERRQKILQNVRLAWLDLYYQNQASELVIRSQRMFDELVKVTQSRYRSGRGTQQDMVRAELELSQMEDRLTAIRAQQDVGLAELARWLDEPTLSPPIKAKFPEFSALPTRDEVLMRAQRHSVIAVQDARVASKREGVAVARAMYMPEMMIDVSYGQRDGNFSDMLTGIVSIQVPLFTSKRQDRQLAAAQLQVKAVQGEANELRRQLRAQADAEYARWQRSNQRLKFHEEKLLPLATQNSESSLTAYRNNVTDLSSHIMARLEELDGKIEALALRVERGKAHANLLYLISEE